MEAGHGQYCRCGCITEPSTNFDCHADGPPNILCMSLLIRRQRHLLKPLPRSPRVAQLLTCVRPVRRLAARSLPRRHHPRWTSRRSRNQQARRRAAALSPRHSRCFCTMPATLPTRKASTFHLRKRAKSWATFGQYAAVRSSAGMLSANHLGVNLLIYLPFRKSHATFPLLPAPTPAAFPLDFAQLLQATAANPSRARARGTPGRELRHECIVEEDDGWDLVDDIST